MNFHGRIPAAIIWFLNFFWEPFTFWFQGSAWEPFIFWFRGSAWEPSIYWFRGSAWEPTALQALPAESRRSLWRIAFPGRAWARGAFWFLALYVCQPAIAQPPQQSPYSNPSQYAVAGQPFGVGRVTIPLVNSTADQLPRIFVDSPDHRIFYPAMTLKELPAPPPPGLPPIPPGGRRFGNGVLMNRLRTAIDSARTQVELPKAVQIDFLFIGAEPLLVEVRGSIHQSISMLVEIPPAQDANRLVLSSIQTWYDAYVASNSAQIAAGDFSPLFQTFLVETLARRLSLLPADLRPASQPSDDPLSHPLSSTEMLAGTEAFRDAVFRDTLRRPATNSLTDDRQPLPAPPLWQALPIPPTPDSLPIELVAQSVPPECFYLRFGSFKNYLWFRDLSAGKGAGLAQLVTIRGSDALANAKIETMLNTRTTVIAKLFGDSIINDMVILGNDLYLQDGASLGVLFDAKNVARLQSAIDGERASTAKGLAEQGVQLDTIKIGTHEATLLSNRDHSIRSFRAVYKNRMLVCTSETMVRRFFEVCDGAPSLADSPSFRYARLLLPLQNDYGMFGFFSPEFFQQLLSPQYQIELRRRYASKARLESLRMAELMADAERIPHGDLNSLVYADLLPAWFNDSADGSQIVLQKIGDSERWVDSRRGGLGAMLPISDVPVVDCTTEEAAKYAADSNYYSTQWRTTEALYFGLRHFESPLGSSVERIAVEAYIAPLEIGKLGQYARYLAPPVNTIITTPPDDMVTIQAHTAGQSVMGATAPDNVMFAGLKDTTPPPPDANAGLLQIWQSVRSTPFYLGAWPKPGYLDQLPLGIGRAWPDQYGFSKSLIGLWRWQGNGFSVLSFDRSILDNAVAYLQPVAAPDPAQVRVQMKDLEHSKLANWVNTFWYRRQFAAARGNLKLLDAMQQQFHLEPQAAYDQVQRLLDMRLVCPLGGQYVIEDFGSQPVWSDTALNRLSMANRNVPIANADMMLIDAEQLFPPPDYVADWLGWLRGVQAHMTQSPEGLVLIATADLEQFAAQPDASEPLGLPPMNFDLFNNLPQWFGGKANAPANQPTKPKQRSF